MSCNCGASCNDFSAGGLVVGVPGTRGPVGPAGPAGPPGSELLAELTDVTPVGLAVGTAVDARSARTAINASGVNVLDFIPNPADRSSHNAGFQAAIDAAVAGDGSQVVVPEGDWHITGLTIPGESALRITGSNPEFFTNTSATPASGTRLRRVGSGPAITIRGTHSAQEYDGATGNARNVTLENFAVYDGNLSATTPLVVVENATQCNFYRFIIVRLSGGGITGNPAGPPLLDIVASQDLRFLHCGFVGGGRPAGASMQGAVRIRGASPSGTVRMSNAIWFTECYSQSYFGPAIEIVNEVLDVNKRVDQVFFRAHKAESWENGDTPTLVIGRASNVFFENTTLFHKTTATTVVDIINAFDVFGTLNIYRTGNATVDPQSRVRFGANCSLVNLTIQVGAATPGTANIIEMPFAVATDPRVNVDVFGPSREINGQTKLVQRVEAGTVQQFAGENNTTCQYAFSRSGYNVWGVGNPANLVGDSQDFSIISSDRFNNVVTMMILRTSGHVAGGTNPATAAYREMRVNGLLTLSSSRRGWIGFPVSPVALPANPNPGSRRLHVNAAGNLAVDTTEVSMRGHTHVAGDVFGAVGLADTPTSASSPGEPGDVSYGPDHFYVCVAPNTWKRATITSW